MFCHKCDIADLILAASEDLGSCPTNACSGQPVSVPHDRVGAIELDATFGIEV